MSGMKSIRRTLKDGMVHETLMFMSPFKSPDPNERHVTIDTPCCDMDFLRTMMRDEYTPENLARLAQEYRRAPVRVEHLSHAIGKTDRSYIEDEMFNGVLEIYSIDSMRSPNGEPSPLEDFQREVIEQISRGELAFISLGVSYLADKVTGVPYPKPGFRIREVTLTRDPARPLAPYRHIALSGIVFFSFFFFFLNQIGCGKKSPSFFSLSSLPFVHIFSFFFKNPLCVHVCDTR